MKNTLIVIQGPTAVGKTAIAIALAKRLNTDIINADSRQVFREMKIGTARPDELELEGVRHHLLGYKSISDTYNAELFAKDARDIIDDFFKDNQTLILTGGSGFYIQAILENMDHIPNVPDSIRSEINDEVKLDGITTLLKELEEKDPEYFKIIDKQNPQRIIRALEVIRFTAKPFSSFHNKQKSKLPYRVLNFALTRERENLYHRINERVEQMLLEGLEKEVMQLKSHKQLNALQTVGYSEIFDYLDGKINREESIQLIKRNTRRFAKRQLTWLRRFDDLNWLNLDQEKRAVDQIIKKLDGLA